MKKGFTLVELLVVIAIIGILAANCPGEFAEREEQGEAGFVSFKAVSVNPAAMSCADEDILAVASDAPGEAICADTNVEDSVYPVLASGVCDGNTYTVAATDATAADGQYQVVMTCTIAATARVVTCTESGCTP